MENMAPEIIPNDINTFSVGSNFGFNVLHTIASLVHLKREIMRHLRSTIMTDATWVIRSHNSYRCIKKDIKLRF